MNRPSVAIGVPVHAPGAFLRPALEALAAQTHKDFGVILLDDASADGSSEILKEWAGRDPRFQVVRSEQKLGMVGAWRLAARRAAEAYGADLFAWYGDHDWVAADWLEHLVQSHRDNPRCVVAHARTAHTDLTGKPVASDLKDGLVTAGMDVWARLSASTVRSYGAGDMVYGLFRREALERCGVYREEVLPDRLLLSEISLYGEAVRAEDAVRYRRHTEPPGIDRKGFLDRQLFSLFPPGRQKSFPFLSYATCFLRGLCGPSGDVLPGVSFERIHHAHLHFTFSLRKFRSRIEAELSSGEPLGELASWAGLAKSFGNSLDKGIPRAFASVLRSTPVARLAGWCGRSMPFMKRFLHERWMAPLLIPPERPS